MATYTGVMLSNSLAGSKKLNIFRIGTLFSSSITGTVESIRLAAKADKNFAGNRIAVHMAKTTSTLTVGKVLANYSGARTINTNIGLRTLSLFIHKGIISSTLVGTRTRCSLCAIDSNPITGSRTSSHTGFIANNNTTKTPPQNPPVPRIFPLERQWQGIEKAAL